jgi:hypothetical protein
MPDLHALSEGLTVALTETGMTDGPVVVLDRKNAPYGSTFPAEILKCRLGSQKERTLYCKYGVDIDNAAHGHRGAVAYESIVYRNLLRTCGLSTAMYYGSYRRNGGKELWLILEFLEDARRVNKATFPGAMKAAARWIGHFHAQNVGRNPEAWLKSYGAEYYLGWARRTLLFTQSRHRDFPWIKVLCEAFPQLMEVLLAAPTAIIHGEYYPKNVLACGGDIYPVDWESAALAAGEIDFASLVSGWPEDVIRECKVAYAKARWGTDVSAAFERRCEIAALYWNLRWLGEANWPQPNWGLPSIEGLRRKGLALGLI